MNDPLLLTVLAERHGLGYVDEPDTVEEPVDELECSECKNPVGQWTDTDDNGRATVAFIAYTIVEPPGYQIHLLCEECDDLPD